MRFPASLLSLCIFFSGCSVHSGPSYTTENLSQSLEKILREEYQISAVSRLAKQTLWTYLPLEEEIFIEADKPESYTKIFNPKSIEGNLRDGMLSFDYEVEEISGAKESQNKKFNPEIADKMNKALRSIRRVLFSLKRDGDEPKFFVIVATDIKNGVELNNITCIDDLRKASYEIISWSEYQHRNLEDIKISLEAIGDKEGRHVEFRNINFNEFLVAQIEQRLRLKFNRPEVEKGVDIDKEVLKTVRNVFQIYGFEDFSQVKLRNLATNNKITLSKAAVLEETKE